MANVFNFKTKYQVFVTDFFKNREFSPKMLTVARVVANEYAREIEFRFQDMVLSELKFYGWRGQHQGGAKKTAHGRGGWVDPSDRADQSFISGYGSSGKAFLATRIPGRRGFEFGFGDRKKWESLKTKDGLNLSRLIEYGTQAHYIEPVNKKALRYRYYDADYIRKIFPRLHPGSRKFFFFTRMTDWIKKNHYTKFVQVIYKVDYNILKNTVIKKVVIDFGTRAPISIDF